MKRILKWLGIVVGVVVGIALLGVAYIYFASWREQGRQYAAKEPAPVLPTDAAAIAEGARLARMHGCLGCHGETLTGLVVFDIPNVVRFTGPNLTTLGTRYTDAQLADVIRRGVKADGTSTWFMPANMFAHLRDDDLARIIAYLRSLAPAEGLSGGTEMRPLGRYIVASGQFSSSAREVEEMGEVTRPIDLEDPLVRGRYLVMTTCVECHGLDLGGRPAAHAPGLVVAKGYSAEQFTRLMREGIAIGDRKLDLMTRTALGRFGPLTGDEIGAIYTYLQSRP